MIIKTQYGDAKASLNLHVTLPDKDGFRRSGFTFTPTEKVYEALKEAIEIKSRLNAVNRRTPEQWKSLIEGETDDPRMRNWMSQVVNFHYQDNGEDWSWFQEDCIDNEMIYSLSVDERYEILKEYYKDKEAMRYAKMAVKEFQHKRKTTGSVGKFNVAAKAVLDEEKRRLSVHLDNIGAKTDMNPSTETNYQNLIKNLKIEVDQ